MNWKSPITRIILVLLIVGMAGGGIATWREYERAARIEQEIDLLRAEAQKIEHENQGLSEKIAYFASPNFQEQEAKQKLGFKRPEEEVVLIPPEGDHSALGRSSAVSDSNDQDLEVATPRYIKWWRFFQKQ